MAQIDFWYSIGSTYSYMTVMRLAGVEADASVTFRWRPFNVRHIMFAQDNMPFRGKPEKTAYMWRDIERRSQRYGLKPELPAPYPLEGLIFANQIAMVGVEEGWVEDYTRATYRHWFELGQPAGEDPNMSASLREIGQDPARVRERARSGHIETALSSVTDEAMVLGIFGSPTFIVDGEVFWGDDRLEDAIHWAKGTWH